jgi:DNA-binding transcriptional MerR regulator
MEMSIGELARASGVKVPTIRFYEQIGLLPTPHRADNNRRIYDARAAERLAFVKHARQLGFAVEAIRALLDLSDHPDRSCADANRLAELQLAAVEEKIVRLSALRTELQRMLAEGCDGRAAECRVIEVLGDHRLCAGDHAVAEPHVLDA